MTNLCCIVCILDTLGRQLKPHYWLYDLGPNGFAIRFLYLGMTPLKNEANISANLEIEFTQYLNDRITSKQAAILYPISYLRDLVPEEVVSSAIFEFPGGAKQGSQVGNGIFSHPLFYDLPLVTYTVLPLASTY